MLRLLLRPGDAAAVVPLPAHASWTAEQLRRSCAGLATPLRQIASPPDGLDWLVDPAAGAILVVAGSLLLVAAVLPLLEPEECAGVDPSHPS